jgi:hypothetical protein
LTVVISYGRRFFENKFFPIGRLTAPTVTTDRANVFRAYGNYWSLNVFDQEKLPIGRSVSALTVDFDTFLCHNSEDKLAVKKIDRQLIKNDLNPWLDEREIQPGVIWQRVLEEQILRIQSACVFIGESGVGPWQQLEVEAFLREFVKRRCPVIPVILPSAHIVQPELPVFLRGMMWVDFRKTLPNPIQQLIWGITGKRPNKNLRG